MDKPANARLIAYYLPQFHPIPENDLWWEKGFTEWTNVTRAKPLFRDHYQPQLPSELGFYDLRIPEAREAQAALAREYGIEGFCYWHYWFAGDRLLERPFQEVLESGKPDFPFCLGWANENWNGLLFAGGDEKKLLKEQTYPGRPDHKRHFDYLLKAFRDHRYIRVDGKPLIVIYRPLKMPDVLPMLNYWRELAVEAGLGDIYVIATLDYHEIKWDAKGHGFDAVTVFPMGKIITAGQPCLWTTKLKNFLRDRKPRRIHHYVDQKYPGLERVYNYEEIRPFLLCNNKFDVPYHPMILPNWDTTPRYQRKAIILHNSTPEAFREHLRDVLQQTASQPQKEKIIFVKSWNEWAEGNYMEPDQRFGRAYLEVLKEELAAGNGSN
jgi:hypothetical protein